jgi:hypothetical protein
MLKIISKLYMCGSYIYKKWPYALYKTFYYYDFYYFNSGKLTCYGLSEWCSIFQYFSLVEVVIQLRGKKHFEYFHKSPCKKGCVFLNVAANSVFGLQESYYSHGARGLSVGIKEKFTKKSLLDGSQSRTGSHEHYPYGCIGDRRLSNLSLCFNLHIHQTISVYLCKETLPGWSLW